MIRIIFDPEKLITYNGEKIIDDISAYTRIYAQILDAAQRHNDLHLVVQHRAFFQWIKNLSSRYPIGSFIFETIDARGALASQWGVDIPASVTNQDIAQIGLPSSNLRPQPGFSF